MKILLVTVFALLVFGQCPSQNSDKELELKERELALKEKEMEIKDKDKDKEEDSAQDDDEAEEKTKKKKSSADSDDVEDKTSKKEAKSEDKPSSSGTTAIKFDRGKSSKTVSVSLKKGESKRYSLDVGKGQVINVEALTDGSTINLINGKQGVDNWEDSTYSLSILTGRKGIYIFEVANQFKEDLTIPIKVTITNDPDDYEGGIQ